MVLTVLEFLVTRSKPVGYNAWNIYKCLSSCFLFGWVLIFFYSSCSFMASIKGQDITFLLPYNKDLTSAVLQICTNDFLKQLRTKESAGLSTLTVPCTKVNQLQSENKS